MARFRPLISFVLVLCTVFLVSCGGPAPTTKGPVYTPEQTAIIERYSNDLADLRDRILSELSVAIQDRNWVDVGTFIHGPLGELRSKMANLARNLTPDLQPQARAKAKEVFEHLVNIDEAAAERNFEKAATNYREALKDLDAFLDLIPVGLSSGEAG
jgi:photosystem II protein PsbQ